MEESILCCGPRERQAGVVFDEYCLAVRCEELDCGLRERPKHSNLDAVCASSAAVEDDPVFIVLTEQVLLGFSFSEDAAGRTTAVVVGPGVFLAGKGRRIVVVATAAAVVIVIVVIGIGAAVIIVTCTAVIVVVGRVIVVLGKRSGGLRTSTEQSKEQKKNADGRALRHEQTS